MCAGHVTKPIRMQQQHQQLANILDNSYTFSRCGTRRTDERDSKLSAFGISFEKVLSELCQNCAPEENTRKRASNCVASRDVEREMRKTCCVCAY